MKSILFLRALAVLVICGVRKWQGACRRSESTRQRLGTARRAADSCGTQYASFDMKSTRPSHRDSFMWPGAWPRERVCATAAGPRLSKAGVMERGRASAQRSISPRDFRAGRRRSGLAGSLSGVRAYGTLPWNQNCELFHAL